jgi:hypothetical protein
VEVGLDKSTLTLTLTARATGQTETRTLTWDGVRFTPGIGAFRLP